jgi:RNA-binding protein YlmH
MNEREEQARLLARAEDLAERARKGEITYTRFLSPKEQHLLLRLPGFGAEEVWCFGGYESAERKRAFFLPPYMQEIDAQTRCEWLADTLQECMLALSVRGSGFRELSHRDYLGAVLNLGIERNAIGDVCICSPHEAVLFCDCTMAAFLQEQLSRVANDAVRVTPISLSSDFDGGRAYRPITDTVASPRADSVVAALSNLSRERAQALFREGLVEIDYEPAQKPDKLLDEGCVVVIRGKGKFIIRSLSEQTKKGRCRLRADQYL